MLLLRPYLEGKRFTIMTDHDALKWILNLSNAVGRLARWRFQLFEFEFEDIHRADEKRQAADALSTLRTGGEETTGIDDDLPKCSV